MISDIELYSIINYLLGDVSAEEKAEIEKKLTENSDFKFKFDQFRETWNKTGIISEVQKIDVADEWQAFQALRRAHKETALKSDKKKSYVLPKFVIAASIALAIAVSSILYFSKQTEVQQPRVEQVAYYTPSEAPVKQPEQAIQSNREKVLVHIPKGQRRQIILPDGTKVWLNSRSSLSYISDFNITTRTVYLEGEAYFEVAHNKKKPFRVKAKGITIKVLGTIFNVSAYPEDEVVETALISGSISMTDTVSAKMIVLEAKEAVLVDLKSGNSIKNTFKDDIYSAWKDGELVFSNELPRKVFEKLERTFNKPFIYDPSIVENKRLTAHFQKGESLERILEVTAKALKVKIEESSGEVIITEQPKTNNYNERMNTN